MIVRIFGEGQFRLPDADAKRLNELDNAATAAAESGDEPTFRARFQEMMDLVRTDGQPLGDDELEPSDVILPPADMTFEEMREEFTGEGLIPD